MIITFNPMILWFYLFYTRFTVHLVYSRSRVWPNRRRHLIQYIVYASEAIATYGFYFMLKHLVKGSTTKKKSSSAYTVVCVWPYQ